MMMSKCKKWYQKPLPYAAVFAASAVAVLLAMLYTGITPFGNHTFLIMDMNIQYVDFFTYLRRGLLEDGSLLYSFTKSLGGNTLALLSYYLSSPLNFLCVFFSPEQMPLFISLLTVLKVALCGATALLFIRRRFPALPAAVQYTMAFSYALMQYNIAQASNIMWLDGVILLPLVLYGVYRVVTTGRVAWYSIALALAIVCNWYTAYMICIMVVLYFCLELLAANEFRFLNKWRLYFKKLLRMAGASLFAVCLSAFWFLPTVYALRQGKGGIEPEMFRFQFKFSFLEVFRGLFTANGKENIPALFCGALAILLCLVFFFHKKISVREKLVSGGILGFLLFACCFIPLDSAMSGMRMVYSYFFRYAFLIGFMIIYLACRCFSASGGMQRRLFLPCEAGCVALGLVLETTKAFPRTWALYLSFAFLLGIALLLLKAFDPGCSKQTKKRLIQLCCCITVLDLAANACLSFNTAYSHTKEDAYQEYATNMRAVVDAVEHYDSSDYRMEKLFSRVKQYDMLPEFNNEAMAYGYRGLTHYSSSFDNSVTQFLIDLGYCKDGEITTCYQNPILLSDSLLAIKYVVGAEKPNGFQKVEGISLSDGNAVYENPYALPFGYRTDAQALAPLTRDEKNPFDYQNTLLSALLGREVACFKQIPAADADVHVVEQMDKNGDVKSEKEALWSVTVPNDDPVYAYIASHSQGSCALYIDNQFTRPYFSWFSYGVFDLAEQAGGETHTVSIRGDFQIDNLDFHAYYLDMELFEQVIQELRAQAFQPSKMADGALSGTYEAAQDGYLLLSIPYDQGWSIRVNGKKADAAPALEACMAIPVTQGSNQIELHFLPPMLIPGIAISCLAALALGTACLYRQKKRKNLPIPATL